jgi:hypothetical protein
MAFNNDETVLYAGYSLSRGVVAWDVAALRPLWTRDGFEGRVLSVAYHSGLVFVSGDRVPLTLLSAKDGSIVRNHELA